MTDLEKFYAEFMEAVTVGGLVQRTDETIRRGKEVMDKHGLSAVDRQIACHIAFDSPGLPDAGEPAC